MAEKIQVQYAKLDLLIYQVYEQAYQTKILYEKLRSQKETLENTWRGGGADEFQQEMDDLVLPGLKRLSDALKETGDLFERIKAIFLVAEKEAVACFPDGSENAQDTFLEWAHRVLMGAGFIEWGGIGIAAGVVDTGLYAYEGRWSEAGWSLVATIPFGDYIKAAKMGGKAGREILEESLKKGAKELGEESLERTARESLGSGAVAKKVAGRGQVRPPMPRGAHAPRSHLNRFSEPLRVSQGMRRQEEILELARTNPQEAGRQYERLVASDIQGGLQVENRFSRPGRRMDIGTEHEVTIEGMNGGFSSNKLDQMWDDLADKRNVTLTVPRLSQQADDQLQRLLAQARAEIDPNVIIVVRETLPR